MGGTGASGSERIESFGARHHAESEYGVRVLRRALKGMTPALPVGSQETAIGTRRRLGCTEDMSDCVACDPAEDASCREALVPLLALIVSDEEAFGFKDECQRSAQLADKVPLPSLCVQGQESGERREAIECAWSDCAASSPSFKS